MGDLAGARASAAFTSASRRGHVAPSSTPGPGEYTKQPGARPKLRRSASFGSTSERFKSSQTITPGPGSYREADGTGVPRRGQLAAAAFSSRSARTGLPTNPMDKVVPGPGGYEHSNPVSDSARPLRRSASFGSRTKRNFGGVSAAAAATPPPGAYNPRAEKAGVAAAGATQRYSIRRTVLAS